MNSIVNTHGLRYLTAGSAHVIVEHAIHSNPLGETRISFPWRFTCYGCGYVKDEDWDETCRLGAQGHAEMCRAIPHGYCEPEVVDDFAVTLRRAIDRSQRSLAADLWFELGVPFGTRTTHDYWLDFTPKPNAEDDFAEFIRAQAALWAQLAAEDKSSTSTSMAERYHNRYVQMGGTR